VDAHARAGSATAAEAMVKADIVSIGVSPRVPWGVWVVRGGIAFFCKVSPRMRRGQTGGHP
jgi:hypothetical protein